jgi:hypothetical protein
MTYHFTIMAAGFDNGPELSKERYDRVMQAGRRLILATDLEVNLELLLENHLDYERTLLEIALQRTRNPTAQEMAGDRDTYKAGRRVMNVLSSARGYIDQTQHVISRLYPNAPNELNRVKEAFSRQYDSHLEYRLAETLRHAAQHRILPLHQFSWRSSWDDMDDETKMRLRFSASPSLLVEQFEPDDIKPTVMSELRASGTREIRLTHVLRRYIECLASVHEDIRATVATQVAIDQAELEAALETARAAFDRDLTGLAVTAVDPDGRISDARYIGDRYWTERDALVRKNRNFKHFSRRFVSSEYLNE